MTITIYVPRSFGGTLILTVAAPPIVTVGVLTAVLATFRDGIVEATFRDGLVQAGGR